MPKHLPSDWPRRGDRAGRSPAGEGWWPGGAWQETRLLLPTGERLSQAAPRQKRSSALAEHLKMSALFVSETIFTFYILIILNFGNYQNMVRSLYSVILALAVLTDLFPFLVNSF